MKGQYLTIEYVIFFAIGIAMVIAVYSTFFNISNDLSKDSMEAQLEREGEIIIGSIVNTFEVSKSTDSTIIYNLTIPFKLSGCVYAIQTKDKLHINCTDNYNIGAVLSFNGVDIKGEDKLIVFPTKKIIYSTRGFVEIINKNGIVELR